MPWPKDAQVVLDPPDDLVEVAVMISPSLVGASCGCTLSLIMCLGALYHYCF